MARFFHFRRRFFLGACPAGSGLDLACLAVHAAVIFDSDLLHPPCFIAKRLFGISEVSVWTGPLQFYSLSVLHGYVD